jgi:hypothetical protein
MNCNEEQTWFPRAGGADVVVAIRVPWVETQGFMPAWRRHAPLPILAVFNREAVKECRPVFEHGACDG